MLPAPRFPAARLPDTGLLLRVLFFLVLEPLCQTK